MSERNMAFALFSNPDLLKTWRDEFISRLCECKQPPGAECAHQQNCKAFETFLSLLEALGRGHSQPPNEPQEPQIFPSPYQ